MAQIGSPACISIELPSHGPPTVTEGKARSHGVEEALRRPPHVTDEDAPGLPLSEVLRRPQTVSLS